MDLPRDVLCEKCGLSSQVVTRKVDEHAIGGSLAANDERRVEGFLFTIDCPNCGVRSQYLAPPP